MGDPTAAPSFVRDGTKFDAFQRRVAEEILRVIRMELEKARFDAKRVQELTMTLAFHVCAIVDGSAMMEDQQRPVVPVLSFSESRDEADKLILDAFGVGSYMHELLAEIADHVFEDDEVTST